MKLSEMSRKMSTETISGSCQALSHDTSPTTFYAAHFLGSLLRGLWLHSCLYCCCCLVTKSCLLFVPPGLKLARLLCPWDFPSKNTGVSCYFLLQGIFPIQGSNLHLQLLLLLLSRFSRVQLCVTPQTAAHQVPPSLGFSRQEHWSGLPFPSLGDLPNPGIKSASPALADKFFTTEPQGRPSCCIHLFHQTEQTK